MESEESLGIVLLVVTVLTWFYLWSTRTYSYWKDRGVAYPKPIPLFGNTFDSITGRIPNAQLMERIYNKLRNHHLAGYYNFRTPVFLLHRPELIEAFLIKDFTHFYNRGLGADPKLDPLTENLLNMEDEKWRALRNKLTPVFSSGKLRIMEEKLRVCASDLLNYIKNHNGEALEAKEIMSRFTMNVILAVAFGLQEDVINNPNSKFRQLGEELFKTTWLAKLRLIIRFSMPKLLSILRWKAMSNEGQDFFAKVVKDTIKYRESNGVEGKDFLQLLINLRKEEKDLASNIHSVKGMGENHVAKNGNVHQLDNSRDLLNDQRMIANAFVFFSAGFETTATCLSFCLFELSRNQDIQERLYRDIKETLDKNDGIQSYDVLKQMTYLDQVLNETLRLWPPVPSTLRVCTKDYRVPNTDLLIRKGDRVQIPIYPIHRDAKYWPDPLKFNPDRFSPEEKKKIVKGSFNPFGDGPRICIGMRFALYEMKMVLANIILSYKISLNPKTKTPIALKKTAMLLAADGGMWLNFEKR